MEARSRRKTRLKFNGIRKNKTKNKERVMKGKNLNQETRECQQKYRRQILLSVAVAQSKT